MTPTNKSQLVMCSPTQKQNQRSKNRSSNDSNDSNTNTNRRLDHDHQYHDRVLDRHALARILRKALETALHKTHQEPEVEHEQRRQQPRRNSDCTNTNAFNTSDIDWSVVNEILEHFHGLFCSYELSASEEYFSDKAKELLSTFDPSMHDMNDKEIEKIDDNIDGVYDAAIPSAGKIIKQDDDMDLDCDHAHVHDRHDYDPDGRQLVCKLLSCDPPFHTLQLFLSTTVFRRSVHQNPAAFFTASRYCCCDQRHQHQTRCIAKYMMEHVVSTTTPSSLQKGICPYPWLLSPHISVDAARGILEAFPLGVWQQMGSFSRLGLLDHLLWSDQMVSRRDWDSNLWMKFKLVIVAAECSSNPERDPSTSFSPIRMILDRILAKNDFFQDRSRAQHVLWLLHHLRQSDSWVFSKPSTKDGMIPLHFLISQKLDLGIPPKVSTSSQPVGLVVARELCKVIIAGYPEAVRQALTIESHRQTLLPLHKAIENGWPCHDLMLSVFPESLEIADPRTGLFPFQIAASQCNVTAKTDKESQQQDMSLSPVSHIGLSVTFELLRSNPLKCSGESGCSSGVVRSKSSVML